MRAIREDGIGSFVNEQRADDPATTRSAQGGNKLIHEAGKQCFITLKDKNALKFIDAVGLTLSLLQFESVVSSLLIIIIKHQNVPVL